MHYFFFFVLLYGNLVFYFIFDNISEGNRDFLFNVDFIIMLMFLRVKKDYIMEDKDYWQFLLMHYIYSFIIILAFTQINHLLFRVICILIIFILIMKFMKRIPKYDTNDEKLP